MAALPAQHDGANNDTKGEDCQHKKTHLTRAWMQRFDLLVLVLKKASEKKQSIAFFYKAKHSRA